MRAPLAPMLTVTSLQPPPGVTVTFCNSTCPRHPDQLIEKPSDSFSGHSTYSPGRRLSRVNFPFSSVCAVGKSLAYPAPMNRGLILAPATAESLSSTATPTMQPRPLGESFVIISRVSPGASDGNVNTDDE